MVRVEFKGRMGNNFLQYLHGRLVADSKRWGITGPPTGPNWNISFFPNFRYHDVVGAVIVSQSETCGEQYKQHYLLFQHARKLARCIFKPSSFLDLPLIGPYDLVIHYRDANHEGQKDVTVPQLDFYTYIIDMLWNETGHSTIHFLSEPRYRNNHHIVDGLKKWYPTRLKVSGGTPETDMAIGLRAPILIVSALTFSWNMAFMTLARRIFMIYRSDIAQGSAYYPGADMFIHDDPRIMYHDVSVYPVKLETAQQVMTRNSPFASTVKGRLNPCSGVY